MDGTAATAGSGASVTSIEAKVGIVGSGVGLKSSIQRYSNRGPILYRRATAETGTPN